MSRWPVSSNISKSIIPGIIVASAGDDAWRGYAEVGVGVTGVNQQWPSE